jgi:hypothetical protein
MIILSRDRHSPRMKETKNTYLNRTLQLQGQSLYGTHGLPYSLSSYRDRPLSPLLFIESLR